MALRDEFVAGLKILAAAFDEVVARGHDRPILVGGAAVEFYTSGAIISGDFDVVTPAEGALVSALLHRGFRKEDRAGWVRRGYYHPQLSIGLEVVGRVLFEGHGDPARALLVEIAPEARVAIVAIEDLIADRMGQFCSVPQGVSEMLEQAVTLLRLAESLDDDYLDKRILKETSGECDLEFLKSRANR